MNVGVRREVVFATVGSVEDHEKRPHFKSGSNKYFAPEQNVKIIMSAQEQDKHCG